jgi:hypothetical protein
MVIVAPDYTQTHTHTLVRSPLDEGSARKDFFIDVNQITFTLARENSMKLLK